MTLRKYTNATFAQPFLERPILNFDDNISIYQLLKEVIKSLAGTFCRNEIFKELRTVLKNIKLSILRKSVSSAWWYKKSSAFIQVLYNNFHFAFIYLLYSIPRLFLSGLITQVCGTWLISALFTSKRFASLRTEVHMNYFWSATFRTQR